jgi:hypothetical protein
MSQENNQLTNMNLELDDFLPDGNCVNEEIAFLKKLFYDYDLKNLVKIQLNREYNKKINYEPRNIGERYIARNMDDLESAVKYYHEFKDKVKFREWLKKLSLPDCEVEEFYSGICNRCENFFKK